METLMMAGETLRNTAKLYYRQPYLTQTRARIVRVHPDALELDRTVAYPEGGGQEADSGTIWTPAGPLRFVGAKKLYGAPIELEGFKGGRLGGIILHLVDPEQAGLLDELEPGMDVSLAIDVPRRAWLTLSHSASHFLYAGVLQVRPELNQWTIGCHIKETSARFDFLVEAPFEAEEVAAIEQVANALIARGEAIVNEAVQGLEDARLWRYGEIEIPCGGTHLESPGAIGRLSVRRKRLGKNKERLVCEFPDAQVDLSPYRGAAA